MRFRGSFPGNSHNSFRDYGIYIYIYDIPMPPYSDRATFSNKRPWAMTK